MIFTEKRGFPFFPCERLRKLSHFRPRMGPRTKLTPKIFFVIPDPMRLCKMFYDRQFFFSGFFKSFLRFENLENLNFCVYHPIWVKFVIGQRTRQRAALCGMFSCVHLTIAIEPATGKFKSSLCCLHIDITHIKSGFISYQKMM